MYITALFSSADGTQILDPMGEIKTINIFGADGAAVDIYLSFIIVPIFAQFETSIAYSINEMTDTILFFCCEKACIN